MEKKTDDKLNRKKITALQVYVLITAAEVLLLAVGSIRILLTKNPSYQFNVAEELSVNTDDGDVAGNMADVGIYEYQKVSSPFVPLKKGVYNVSIGYESNCDAQVSYDTRQSTIDRFVADEITLSSKKNQIQYRIWANDDLDTVKIIISPNDGRVQVNRLVIKPDRCSKVYGIICLFLKLFVLNLIVVIICFRNRIKKYWKGIVVVSFITLLSSLGMTARYLTLGHDLSFHLLRIVGLAKAITSGQFPVRVQPNWLNGWGYAVSAMYGDLLLLFPAGLYSVGFDLQTAYKMYVVLVNLLTTIVSAYCFGKIAKNREIGYVVSAMYVLAPYRLMCIYTRAAVGEYTAFLFFPMIMLGFWYAFSEKIEKEKYGTRLLIPVLGFTGLIQTHVLSCYMIGVCLVILLIIEIKKVFRRKTFIYLSKILGYTVIINLSFLIPFMRFSNEKLKISEKNIEMDDRFAAWGVSLVEIFTHSANSTQSFNWEYVGSLLARCSMPLNTAFLIIFVCAVVLVYVKNFKGKRNLLISMGIAAFSVGMTLFIFPYSGLKKFFPKIASMAYTIQFPYRFLGMATLFLAITACLTYRYGKKLISKKWLMVLTVAFLVLTYDQSVSLINHTMYNDTNVICRDGEKLDNCEIVGAQYLYQDASVDYIREHSLPNSGNTEWSGYVKNGLDMFVNCKNTSKDAYIDFPALNYPGYVARDENGQKLEIMNGENYAVRVLLPRGYQGQISVKYQGLLLWHILDVFSVAAFFFFLWKEKYLRFQKRITGEKVINE